MLLQYIKIYVVSQARDAITHMAVCFPAGLRTEEVGYLQIMEIETQIIICFENSLQNVVFGSSYVSRLSVSAGSDRPGLMQLWSSSHKAFFKK